MPVDNEGFIFLYRSMLKDALWIKGSNTQKILMVVLILKVNHQPGEWIWQGEKFTVDRGQTITSYDKLRNMIGEDNSIQQIRTSIKNLEKYKFLTKVSTKTGQLITILNYNKYQADLTKNLTNSQQRPNKQLTPNNNNKKDNNEIKKIKYAEFVYMTEEEHEKLVKKYGDYNTKLFIEKLDNTKGSNLKLKYDSDYRAILKWVVGAVLNKPLQLQSAVMGKRYEKL
jgi:hypothetical protein